MTAVLPLHRSLVARGYGVHEKLQVDRGSPERDITALFSRMDVFQAPEFEVVSGQFVPEILTEEERNCQNTRYFVVYKKESK